MDLGGDRWAYPSLRARNLLARGRYLGRSGRLGGRRYIHSNYYVRADGYYGIQSHAEGFRDARWPVAFGYIDGDDGIDCHMRRCNLWTCSKRTRTQAVSPGKFSIDFLPHRLYVF